MDLTPDIRLSFKLMGRKVSDMLASGKYDKSEMLPVRPCVLVRKRDPSADKERERERQRRDSQKVTPTGAEDVRGQPA